MVQIQQITQAKFLEMYARAALTDYIPLKIGANNVVYARTTEGQASNPDRHIVVYAVIT